MVILANSRQPESVQLARFYAAQRGVPEVNILTLPLPEEESVTWRQFIDQVWQPVQDELYRRGWIEGMTSSLLDRLGRRRYAPTGHRISYLVVCRGVPLRIYHDPLLQEEKPARKIAPELNKNEAAVDAELSLLATSGGEIAGVVPNPLFANERTPTPDAEMVVKVTRLDGPTWASARHLVTSALEAERTGLLGRYYVDLHGPHADGDEWLKSAEKQLQELGFDGDTDQNGWTFTAASRFDAPALYFGWYTDNLNGPFAREGFAFPPGAVALHIHSFSAQTLHSDRTAWCGPLVARGVAATVGNVFEPYLMFTHRPQLLLRALSQGKNFGDAVYFALPALSWQGVAIGDPLYRPFKVSLEKQLQARDRLPPALAPYAILRLANLLARQGKTSEALTLLRGVLAERPNLAIGLGLAKLAVTANDPATVGAALSFAVEIKPVRPEDWPLLREAAGLLAAQGARPAALQVYTNLARAPAPAPQTLQVLLVEARETADAAGDAKLAQEFAQQLKELNAPAP